MPQPSWSPSTTQQLRKLVAAPYPLCQHSCPLTSVSNYYWLFP
ncbi:hypothetical protein [Thiolapillus sp.]|nr:hypothetical protein [Thiolapillus sp.]